MDNLRSTDSKFCAEIVKFFQNELSHDMDESVARTIVIHHMESFSLAYRKYREKPDAAKRDALLLIAKHAEQLKQKFTNPKGL